MQPLALVGKSSLLALFPFSIVVLGRNLSISLVSIYSSSEILLHIPMYNFKNLWGNAVCFSLFFTGFSKSFNFNENFYGHLYISERAEITPTESKDFFHKHNKIQKTKYR